MRIAFWNVMRVGFSTDPVVAGVIADRLDDMFLNKMVRLVILCEITSDSVIGTDDNWNYIVKKTGQRKKRTRRGTAAQLGYALVTDMFEEDPFDLKVQDISKYHVAFPGLDPYKKGGSNFNQISKRNVVRLEGAGLGKKIFAFHVNSSHKAPYVAAWAAQSLRKSYPGEQMVLIGDMNCQPTELTTEFLYYDHPALMKPGFSSNFVTRHDGHTHNARMSSGPTSTLDYAVAINNADVTVTKMAQPGGHDRLMSHPDHLPIIVDV